MIQVNPDILPIDRRILNLFMYIELTIAFLVALSCLLFSICWIGNRPSEIDKKSIISPQLLVDNNNNHNLFIKTCNETQHIINDKKQMVDIEDSFLLSQQENMNVNVNVIEELHEQYSNESDEAHASEYGSFLEENDHPFIQKSKTWNQFKEFIISFSPWS